MIEQQIETDDGITDDVEWVATTRGRMLRVSNRTTSLFVPERTVRDAVERLEVDGKEVRATSPRSALSFQHRTPTPTPTLRPSMFKQRVYSALWHFVHAREIYVTFSINEAIDVILLDPRVAEAREPFRSGLDREFQQMVRGLVQQKLNDAILNASGLRAFHAVPQSDGSYRWVHFRGLTREMLDRLIAEGEKVIGTLREKNRLYRAFRDALPDDGAIIDTIFTETCERLGLDRGEGV